jgi:two-component sensor histidine kinase
MNVAGALVRALLQPVTHGGLPLLMFFPFILVASVWGGVWSGLSTLVLAAAVAYHFWLPPTGGVFLSSSPAAALIAFAAASGFIIVMASLMRALVEVHQEGEDRAILLLHEMRHRSLNLLGIVQAISAQTARGAASVEEHQNLFGMRLMALARAQRLVSESPDLAADLRELIECVIEPFGAERFSIEGPKLSVPHSLGSSCALLFHELGTNATKYGALSVAGGVVAIDWRREGDRVFLTWQERQGPPVVAPQRTGFGARLLQTAFAPQQGGANIAYESDGVRCLVHFTLV